MKFIRWEVSNSHVLWMYLSNLVVLVSGLAVYHWSGARFGPTGFAEYALSRRAVNLLAPALMAGIGVALPRYIAMLAGARIETDRRLAFQVAFGCVCATCGVMAVLALAWPLAAAKLLFGSADARHLVAPLVVFLWGISLHSTVYSFFRGKRNFRSASAMDISNVGLAPILVLCIAGQSAGELMMWTGLVTAGISLTISAHWLRGYCFNSAAWRTVARQLLHYGLPRVPGDFALGAMLAMPSLVVAHMYGIVSAGEIAFGNTMLALAGTAVAPFSTTSLPESAKLISEKRTDDLRRYIAKNLRITMGMALVGLAVAEIFMPFIVSRFLGDEFLPSVSKLRLLAVCVVPYVAYSSLRSVIDAAFRDAINAKNIYFAIATMAAGFGMIVAMKGSVQSIIGVTVLGHLVLGYLTCRTAWQLLGRQTGRIAGCADAGHESPGVVRVLAVIPGAATGSSMIFAKRQCVAIRRHGVEVSEFYISERVRPVGVARELRRLRCEIKRTNPSVVHAHYGTVTALLCALSAGRRPVVITMRGSDLNPSAAVSPVRSVSGRMLSQLSAIRADAVICVSEGLRARMWWRKDRAVVICSGVDTDVFWARPRVVARQELGIEHDDPLVVFNSGRNAWVKDLNLAETVMSLVAFGVARVQLVVMQGDWDPEKVPLLLSAADCLLVASRYEGSPNIVREAIACELPVVSVDVGDVAQQIAGISNCRICNRDPGELSSAIIQILKSGERANGRQRAEGSSVDVSAQAVIAVYARVLSAKG